MYILAEIVATGLYIGRIRYAPGTLGTLLGIPFVYLFGIKWWVVLVLSFILYPLAVWSANHVIKVTREKDPEEVVIDEILGYFVSFLFVEPTLKTIAVAFVAFRLLDIFKPFPISLFEKLPDGHGVVADDFVAGIINAFILFFLFH